MVTDDLPQALDQLAFLGRSRDVAIRPVLLRVMVDMFLHRSEHTEGALRQFEEMFAHLLDDADEAAMLMAAEKLSRHPQTPQALIDRFIAADGAVAGAVLERADLDAGTLQAAAMLGSTEVARATATRPDLEPKTIRSLAERPELEVLHVLIDNHTAPIEPSVLRALARRATGDSLLAAKVLDRTASPSDAAPLFLAASASQRAQMIADARRSDLGVTGRALPLTITAENLAAIDRASHEPDLEGLDLALATCLGLSLEEVETILDDRHGEPLALALAAVGVSADTAARLFIFSHATVRPSYFRIKTLIRLMEQVTPGTAFKLVWTMVGRKAEPMRRTPAQAAAESSARRGPGDFAIRSGVAESDAAQTARRA